MKPKLELHVPRRTMRKNMSISYSPMNDEKLDAIYHWFSDFMQSDNPICEDYWPETIVECIQRGEVPFLFIGEKND